MKTIVKLLFLISLLATITACSNEKIVIYDDKNFVIIEQNMSDGFHQSKIMCEDKDYFCHELNILLDSSEINLDCPEDRDSYPLLWGSVWQEDLGEDFYQPLGCDQKTLKEFNSLLDKYDISIEKLTSDRLIRPEIEISAVQPTKLELTIEKYKRVFIFHKAIVNGSSKNSTANNASLVLQEKIDGQWLPVATTSLNDTGEAVFELDALLNSSGDKQKNITIRVLSADNTKIVSNTETVTLQRR